MPSPCSADEQRALARGQEVAHEPRRRTARRRIGHVERPALELPDLLGLDVLVERPDVGDEDRRLGGARLR